MKIMFVASEGLPFIKSGGLADVVGSLPKILKKKKNDVRVVLPLYLKIANQNRHEFEYITTVNIHCGVINTTASFFQKEVDGVVFYFIEHQGYFEREGLYGYGDDGERFAFFQKAVLELIKTIEFYPDVMHLHDWHTGMIPVLNKFHYGYDENMNQIKFVYTIHNLAFQGNFPAEVLVSCFDLPYWLYEDGTLRFYDGISFMKAGIVFSDKITTVSSTYANEILTPEFGEDMQEALRYREGDLFGIVNGIDTELWDPRSDERLIKNYDLRTVISGKATNKKSLQFELGLNEDSDAMLIGVVSRLTKQKGLHFLLECIDELMNQNVQLVVLGTGESEIEQGLRMSEEYFRGRVVYYCGYNEDLAHKIYAGSDLFLMPSCFEPCGISQLISMRYGSLPLVRETGGLKDTVQPYNEYTNEGNGFSFYSMNSEDMLNTLYYALNTYYNNRKEYNNMIKRAMKTDVSWKYSAEEYLRLYKMLK